MGALGVLLGHSATAVAALISGSVAAPARCSIAVGPVLRTQFTVEVLATARAELLPSTPPSYAPSHTSREGLAGQVLVARDAVGVGAYLLAPSDTGSPVVVVLWDYDGACFPIPFVSGPLLITPGEEVVVSGHLRHPDDWIEGYPTIDSFLAGAFVYPQSSLVSLAPYVIRPTTPAHSPRWLKRTTLDAEAFFRLIADLPSYCAYSRNPFDAIATQLRVSWALRGRENAYPTRELLGRHRHLARNPPRQTNCAGVLRGQPFGRPF